MADSDDIDVQRCPECDNGTKGVYEHRITIGGRGFFTCLVCATVWQDANEKASDKGMRLS